MVHHEEQNCMLQVAHYVGILGCCWTCMQYDVLCISYRSSPSQDRWCRPEVQAAGAFAVLRMSKNSGRAAFCSFCIALALVVPIKGWQALPSSPEPVSWCLEALVLSRSCMWVCTALFSPRCSGSCLAAGVTLCPAPCRP